MKRVFRFIGLLMLLVFGCVSGWLLVEKSLLDDAAMVMAACLIPWFIWEVSE